MYGKIFDSMYEGTLYGHWQAIVSFQQMIILCDADGVVDMTPQAIAARTSIPLEIIQQGIKVLEEPDPYSRTPGEDGRRIVRLDNHRPWGWRIVNHLKYKLLVDAEAVREQNRERQRRHRATQSRVVTEDNGESRSVTTSHATSRSVTHVTPSNAPSRHTDTDTDTDTEASQNGPTDHVGQEPDDPVAKVFDHWRTVHRHPHAKLDEKRRKLIRRALQHYSEADLCRSIAGYQNSPHHMGQNDRDTVYDDIELLLRDSKHIDAGLKFHDEPPRTDLSPLTRRNIDATEGWMPPEMRADGAD